MPHRSIPRRFVIAGALASGALALTASRTAASGSVLLTVESASGLRTLGLAQLDALPQRTIRTSTPWTEGTIAFGGPPLRAVLRRAGIGDDARFGAYALNNYSVEFRPGDVEDDYPILATRMDGRLFGRRELGPLWVLYPYDLDSRYRTEPVYSRSIWQLVRIVVRDRGT